MDFLDGALGPNLEYTPRTSGGCTDYAAGMENRAWVPDLVMIADEVVEDYRKADNESQAFLDGLATLESWKATAESHGEKFQEDDWHALVLELTRRVAVG